MKKKYVILILMLLVIIFLVWFYKMGVNVNVNKNLHEPYSHEEIVNILDPPLDTTKPLNQEVYDKYFYPPTFKTAEMRLLPKILETMSFEQYGNYEAFVFTHPNDSMKKKSERPIYMVNISEKKLFEQAVRNNCILLFKEQRKQIWTFYAYK